ncbi:probable galacturonosyltransferase 6 [Magnolia sinica]|uniref:probable galacturonosyltransferase 6 n=1 Tax=Magnolia sinica TaxID=86752 RepID=UPI002658E17B|nr:probable galacturonosyltransferase 6 [Magnolia sinica]
MKQKIRWQRILILLLLSITFVSPILYLPRKVANFTSSYAHEEFIEDVSSIKYATDTLKLNVIQQEIDEGLKEPAGIVYKDRDYNSVVSGNSSHNDFVIKDSENAKERVSSGFGTVRREGNQPRTISIPLGRKWQSNQATARAEPSKPSSQSRKVTVKKIREMKDQLITAKAYLNFAPPKSNPHLVRDLKQRLKDVERAIGEATRDSHMSKSSLQRMRSMEVALSKASRVFSDCSPVAMKLRAMTKNAQEQLQAQKSQAAYLNQLAARTFPKGLHCLSMLLTADYYSLQPEERELPNRQKFQQPGLYHYAVFSDNVLACAVVVNSTISTSMEPEKIVFHVVTDSLNLPSMMMWFLANPPGEAAIQVECMDDFKWLSSNFHSMSKQPNSKDPRYTSTLNHLRFHLPQVFPMLDKVVLLDHDVAVQRDLRGLWIVDMKGKVNGAVETCGDNDTFHRMDKFLDFSDPAISKTFDVNACTWAFGMNVFDLQEWRRRDLTAIYHKWFQLGKMRQLWKDERLPLGLVTFYNLTVALDRRWHVHGLGYESGKSQGEIEIAAVIHYDGSMKPWLDIGIAEYKGYWKRHVQSDHPYLQRCNIHQ